jgi:alkylated DNA nucleotide flippase Atl1
MAKRKSWREKLTEKKDLPKVVSLKGEAKRRWKADTVAIPSPVEIKEIMDSVPKGRLITVNEIREEIARRHGADIGCPLTCGIFSWIVAHAAEEEAGEGRKRITPYWRTLKAKGELNPKYPGGVEAQKRRLESEGFRIIQKGKRFFVEDYEKYLKTCTS